MNIAQAVPLLRVADVGRTIDWYQRMLGFTGDPFPASPPYEFAILRNGAVELMVRRSTPAARKARQYDWDLYLRFQGNRFREMADRFGALNVVTRRLEHMPYGLAEFEITDPDGNVICMGQNLDDAGDLPVPSA